jgi:[CysO sulfur-carrier protein]-S-L-cysteine hydrolase
MDFPSEALKAAIAHCEATYPNEGCGVFIRDGDGKLSARPMANVIDKYHARDPQRFPRTSRTAYLFDPREQMEVFDKPEPVVCVFHSHADKGAYFSEEDHKLALFDGQPLLPGVSYLVISVRTRADDLKLFTWTGDAFQEEPIPLP